MTRKERKEVKAQHNDPINFTCGVCRKVHKYEGSLECGDAVVEVVEEYGL